MTNKQLIDFITAENALDGTEPVYIAQGGKTRKTLLSKIKEFIIGTTTMGTTSTDVTGAVKEINDKVGTIDVENDGDIASQLNDCVNLKISGILLESNSDLNSSALYTAGTYYYPENNNAISNSPTTDRFKLTVEEIGVTAVVLQTVVTGNTSNSLKVYKRYVNKVLNTFSNWEKVIINSDLGSIANKNYEEGSFTPTIAGTTTEGNNTYSVQVGRYVKIANRVFFDITLALSTKDSNMSGDIRIKGLPFVVKSLNNYRCSCAIYYTSMNLDSSKTTLQAVLFSNMDFITLNKVGNTGSSANIVDGELTDVTRITLSGSYEV